MLVGTQQYDVDVDTYNSLFDLSIYTPSPHNFALKNSFTRLTYHLERREGRGAGMWDWWRNFSRYIQLFFLYIGLEKFLVDYLVSLFLLYFYLFKVTRKRKAEDHEGDSAKKRKPLHRHVVLSVHHEVQIHTPSNLTASYFIDSTVHVDRILILIMVDAF